MYIAFVAYFYIYGTKQSKVLNSVTRQLRWRTEASGWAASAACPHHPTVRVGHSRGLYRHFDLYVGRDERR
jgi:hypothetical protein